ncbi:PPP family 3-phenylpropionic acid transporter [Anoxybacillus tepidamans]|uniref:PPP family 3-phenylpropionic acid transporter n=2 Tax=Anoxybacteroides TaxID=3389905 RepID=A0A7W8ITG8_9BACL|nr:3-phenylpropionate MFS transporter [Anoxybacillus tepidamans]MBB5326393.1 PPP family 3-phenylpropionic acid transporter [Anoxybacillus tepidamans]
MKQTWLSTNFFVFFFTWGIFLPYWTVWLITKGLTAQQAGIVISIGLLVRAFSTSYIFPALCKRYWLSHVSLIVAFLSLIILVCFLPFNNLAWLMLVMVFFSLIYPMLLPINETKASILSKEENGIDYGKCRLWGSFGFILSSVLTGWVASKNANNIIYLFLLGNLFILILSLIRSPSSLRVKLSQRAGGSFELLKSKSFLICLLLSMVLQGTHAAYYNYGVIYLKHIGINSVYIGGILVLAVLAEIGFFYISNRVFTKFDVATMFLLAGIASIIRWSSVYFFENPLVFVFSQPLHALTFGLTHFAFMTFVNQYISKDKIPSAHGLYASLAMSLTTGVLTLVSGYLYLYSPGFPFLGMALVVAPSLFLCPMLKKLTRQSSTFQQLGA